MKKAVIEQLVLGMVGTNTWLIKNKENGELLIVDPFYNDTAFFFLHDRQFFFCFRSCLQNFLIGDLFFMLFLVSLNQLIQNLSFF